MIAAIERGEGESFYWAGGQRVPLYRDSRVFAVRFRPGARADGPLSRRASRLLEVSTSLVGEALELEVAAREVIRDSVCQSAFV